MTIDKRVSDLTANMNARQRTAFMVTVARILENSWTWKQSEATKLFHIYDENNHFLGAGVSLVNAFAESEQAK